MNYVHIDWVMIISLHVIYRIFLFLMGFYFSAVDFLSYIDML